ncbi:hypothetical protein [Phormidesmis priestleyi]
MNPKKTKEIKDTNKTKNASQLDRSQNVILISGGILAATKSIAQNSLIAIARDRAD